jgi:hypothetical protein
MAEIKNHTLSFGCARPRCGLDLAGAKPACAEIERSPLFAARVAHG